MVKNMELDSILKLMEAKEKENGKMGNYTSGKESFKTIYDQISISLFFIRIPY